MASLCGVGEVTEWFKVAVLKAPVAQTHFPRKPRISNENDGANRAIRASQSGSRWHFGRHINDGPETPRQRSRGLPMTKGIFAMAERDLMRVRPYCDWHEDIGDVLWWRIPISEPPYLGSPLDLGREMLVELGIFMLRGPVAQELKRVNICGWPFEDGDIPHLWWTLLPDGKLIEDQVPL